MNYVGIDIGSTASKVAVIGEKEFFLCCRQGGAVKKLARQLKKN